ncbi:hypothetical protein [Radiobacillus sp. PE A8.2]|uniref:hypothetical protein n=1 Tax=Radiobacillus sp. PE A8.2 TaxID=3380349 RepID=UPI00388F808B
MQITTFDRKLWHLTSFDTVGYNRKAREFVVYLFDGTQIHLFDVEEIDIFHFLTALNKDNFLLQILLTRYPYIQIKDKVSHPI